MPHNQSSFRPSGRKQFRLPAEAVIQQAVEALECTDGEALLAEALQLAASLLPSKAGPVTQERVWRLHIKSRRGVVMTTGLVDLYCSCWRN